MEHAVLIVGAGPTGMMLAAELALAGVDVAIIERRADQRIDGSRAGGLHARTIEVFDQRGIADRFLSEGQIAQVAGFAWMRLDISDFPSRHPYGLALPQPHIERILADWVHELGVPVYRESEVAGLQQDYNGVDVALADGTSARAAYLVGCDGGRSTVRKSAGIEFPGWDPSVSHVIAEVEFAKEAQWGMQRDASGIRSLLRMPDGRVRVMLTEPEVGRGDAPTLPDLRALLIATYGTDYGVHTPYWISRFTDMSRQAATYRKERVLLAGDAAHIHYPVGGQGLNIGVQDAINLGWKLAQVVKQTSPHTLLDTYHAERHPVGARVLSNTMAQVALLRADERTEALRELTAELLRMDEARQRFGAMMSGLDVHYGLDEGHPLLGRRMPDLELATANGAKRVYEFLHEARPALINFSEPRSIDGGGWSDRVQRVDAKYEGKWELPAMGEVASPSAVLIRPDGHVAWVGDGSQSGLVDALTTWFGPAS